MHHYFMAFINFLGWTTFTGGVLATGIYLLSKTYALLKYLFKQIQYLWFLISMKPTVSHFEVTPAPHHHDDKRKPTRFLVACRYTDKEIAKILKEIHENISDDYVIAQCRRDERDKIIDTYHIWIGYDRYQDRVFLMEHSKHANRFVANALEKYYNSGKRKISEMVFEADKAEEPEKPFIH